MRIFLSPPTLTGNEASHLQESLESGYLAPAGPQILAFEEACAKHLGTDQTVALNCGTSALHLALSLAGVKAGDYVLVSDFTFIASANPISYLGAHPVFIDADPTTWNMNPSLLENAVGELQKLGKNPAALILVHNYGLPVVMEPFLQFTQKHQIPLIEDAAEALGSSYADGTKPGTTGDFGCFSFNGNKIITTSSGGLLWTRRPEDAQRARDLASQDRFPDQPDFHHRSIAWNYRMSNLLAAVGLAQLPDLNRRVEKKGAIFQRYGDAFAEIDQIKPMPSPENGDHTNRWLSAFTLESTDQRNALFERLKAHQIESRFLWKPLHTQPPHSDSIHIGGEVGKDLHARGIALPCGVGLTEDEQTEIIDHVHSVLT